LIRKKRQLEKECDRRFLSPQSGVKGGESCKKVEPKRMQGASEVGLAENAGREGVLISREEGDEKDIAKMALGKGRWRVTRRGQ